MESQFKPPFFVIKIVISGQTEVVNKAQTELNNEIQTAMDT